MNANRCPSTHCCNLPTTTVQVYLFVDAAHAEEKKSSHRSCRSNASRWHRRATRFPGPFPLPSVQPSTSCPLSARAAVASSNGGCQRLNPCNVKRQSPLVYARSRPCNRLALCPVAEFHLRRNLSAPLQSPRDAPPIPRPMAGRLSAGAASAESPAQCPRRYRRPTRRSSSRNYKAHDAE
jgi:hypothetical protein